MAIGPMARLFPAAGLISRVCSGLLFPKADSNHREYIGQFGHQGCPRTRADAPRLVSRSQTFVEQICHFLNAPWDHGGRVLLYDG